MHVTFYMKNELKNSGLDFFCHKCCQQSSDNANMFKCNIPFKIKEFKKGEYIAYQNTEVKYVYMLKKGRVKTEVVSAFGSSLSIGEIKAPYPLAVAFLFTSKNLFPVDIIAMEHCEVILVKKKYIEIQMASCPHFLHGFLTFIADKMQFLTDRLKIFSLKSIKAKFAFYIMEHAKGEEFVLNSSITSLSEYFGVERPSLSRTIAELGKEGIIEFKSGKGKILKPEILKDLILFNK